MIMVRFSKILKGMQPAFSRKSTYLWFVIVFLGFMCRTDNFGVSSIIRAFTLAPAHYPSLIHFFHSTAWNVEGLMSLWWEQLRQQGHGYTVNDRLVLVGDHTKIPKDGRKIPAVTTLHQDSETGSKPSYFRGHHWGCVGMIIQAGKRFCATPLWATIQEGLADIHGRTSIPKTIEIVQMAQRISKAMNSTAYLVLDAYFSVGPVFKEVEKIKYEDEPLVHVLTRAKKNVVAYRPARQPKNKKRGRKKKYGRKLKLMKLFDSTAKDYKFQKGKAQIYDKQENMRYLVLDLLWKPTKGMLRFILVESSRGRMVLITSDFTLQPVTAVELYCRRVTIETMFDVLKNTLGGLSYHFWSSYLTSASRTPKKNTDNEQHSSNPACTANTLEAIEKFVNIQLLVLGSLQMIARLYPVEVMAKAKCWLRTNTASVPSEFVTRLAVTNIIKVNLSIFPKGWIMQLIQQRQENTEKQTIDKEVA